MSHYMGGSVGPYQSIDWARQIECFLNWLTPEFLRPTLDNFSYWQTLSIAIIGGFALAALMAYPFLTRADLKLSSPYRIALGVIIAAVMVVVAMTAIILPTVETHLMPPDGLLLPPLLGVRLFTGIVLLFANLFFWLARMLGSANDVIVQKEVKASDHSAFHAKKRRWFW